ncbi:MAG: CoA-transferase [Bacillota bacterium]
MFEYGNLNSTMIGSFPEDYRKPQLRLPGSGGASDRAASCERTIIIMSHEKRRFKERLSYLTSPGYLDGSPDARQRAGLLGQGPYRVITTRAILGFDEATHRMKLLATMPGETVKSVQENTGFELLVDDHAYPYDPPTPEELCLIREEIDPQGYFIGRKGSPQNRMNCRASPYTSVQD